MSQKDDFFSAAEKILNDIEAIFKKDPKLKSFEIIPISTNENKSPVYHEENCLGLESWCVPHVYCHTYQNIIKIKLSRNKRRDFNHLNKLLIGALLINPDIGTFWNMRKELVIAGKLDTNFELHLTAVIVTRKPKCLEIFSYRKWILQKMLQNNSEDCALLAQEMDICEVAANRYSNNYHAWTHRLWCLSQGVPVQLNVIQFLQQQLLWSDSWICRHVSDFSGMQYRQQLLKKISALLDSENMKNMLPNKDRALNEFFSYIGIGFPKNILPIEIQLCINELMFISGLITDFEGHEALWYHRRFVFSFIKEIMSRNESFESNKCWGYKDYDHLNREGVPLEKNQKLNSININEKFAWLLSVYEDMFLLKTKSTLNARQKLFAVRHSQWLQKYLKFQQPYNLDSIIENSEIYSQLLVL